MHAVPAVARRGQKITLELELQAVVSHSPNSDPLQEEQGLLIVEPALQSCDPFLL